MKHYPAAPVRILLLMLVAAALPSIATNTLAQDASSRASRPSSAPAKDGNVTKPPFLESGTNAWVDRVYDLKHLDIELWFDLKAKTIRGTTKQTLIILDGDARELPFDAREIRATKTLVNDTNIAFRADAKRLYIQKPAHVKPGDTLQITIDYEGSPTNGLHWTGPEPGYESKWYQCFSQGQSQNNHHWIPMHDYPNDRATWTTTLHVEKELTAVSNGKFLSVTEDKGGATRAWKYQMDRPNCTYLISVAIGPWEKYADDVNGVPVEYYVGPGVGEATARRSFGKTPEMIEFFGEWIGTPYPYHKYSQTAVTEFVTGGMENVSATTQTDLTLHDERSRLERDSDGLVAHELAHQWWGDLLTCNGWRHLWLNEGFATYFTALWYEHAKGIDAYRLYMDGQRAGFLGGDPAGGAMALVTQAFNRTSDAANAHVYTKGSTVLHMLRFVVGDEQFRKAIQIYCKKYQDGLVETRDLDRVFADVTGRGLEWFWQEWVYLHGAPVLEITNTYDADKETCIVTLKQVQKVSALLPLFKMPVDILLAYSGGRTEMHRVWFENAEHRYEFLAAEIPVFVRFDEGSWLGAIIRHQKPVNEWIAQMELDPDPVGRKQACAALGQNVSKRSDAEKEAAANALAKKLTSTDYKEIRVAAADALDGFMNKDSKSALLAALSDSEASVRRSSSRALGKFTNEIDISIVEALKKVATSDQAYGPRAEAIRSLAAIMKLDAFDYCVEMLSMPSERSVIRIAALESLRKIDVKRSIPFLVKACAVGEPYELRQMAVPALATIVKDVKNKEFITDDDRAAMRSAIIAAAGSNHNRLRGAAFGAAQNTNDPEIVTFLESLLKSPISSRERGAVERALQSNREKK
ncbi:MAG: M1 family aminopeptidase [Planctomycetota bacterium]